MSATVPIKTIETVPKETPQPVETRDEKIARYSSPEFTKALTETFHQAKRRAIQADREAAESVNKNNEASPKS